MKITHEMLSIGVGVAIVFGLVLATGCIDDGRTEELDLVIISISPLKEMVERIAGPNIEVVVMVPENVDPHAYSPTPSQLLKVAKADIYFMLGSGLEFENINMDTIKETNPEMKVVDLSEGIDILSFEDHGVHDENEEDDDHDHDGTDPHTWLHPMNMMDMSNIVLDALIKEDPEKSDVFMNNFDSYEQDLNRMYLNIQTKLSPYSGEEFLSYHPAWGYFADAFNLIQIAIEEDGKEPGPQGISDLIDQARGRNITVVFVEPQFDTSAAAQIADSIGGETVVVDPLASNYIDNLEEVAEKMAEGLSKRNSL